jgi:hypothetical protein
MIKSFIRGFYHTLLIQSFLTMVSMLKPELRTDGYILSMFFGHSLVEGHVASTWIHLTSVISKFLPPRWKTIHSPIPGLDLLSFSYVCCGETRHFDAPTLHASLLSTHETTQSSKLPKSRELTTWLRPSDRLVSLLYYIPDPPSPKSRTPGVPVTSPTTLARRTHIRN